ncbi:hypothetical protein SmJEL517_g03016 [Synchytrium microbalum]|uniref:Chromate transporter n=1 Tax=Synchytrium microbalum TaxID=1806994 RepID=A0A507BZT6_9FUNG|nr:uncharacterized protein SmJEL517_g03016 [Synchytrium microbalum]TPX34317.1 hypothetical protein SmJEL517_g03016 [Synchytrium microbalum]
MSQDLSLPPPPPPISPAQSEVTVLNVATTKPDDQDDESKFEPPRLSLFRLFLLFLGFGFEAFGGPVAQIALIKQKLVVEQKWISIPKFNKVYAVYQVLPGPEAAELCCYFGHLSRGKIGALIGGLGFILPGFSLMLLLSWVYSIIGLDNPYFHASFRALQPAVAAMVAVHKLAEHAVIDHKTKKIQNHLLFLALLGALNSALRINFLITLAVFGILNGLYDRKMYWAAGLVFLAGYGAYAAYFAVKGFPSAAALATGIASTPTLARIFAVSLMVGSLSFGGAFTTIPFMQQEAVVVGGWISQQRFLDGIALANVLPAPTVIFTTFVGYTGGEYYYNDIGYAFAGAILATVGIFLPCFAFVIIGHSFFERVVNMPAVSAVLDGVSASVVGIVAVTALQILRSAISVNLVAITAVDARFTAVNESLLAVVVFVAVLAAFLRSRPNIEQLIKHHLLTGSGASKISINASSKTPRNSPGKRFNASVFKAAENVFESLTEVHSDTRAQRLTSRLAACKSSDASFMNKCRE